MFSVFEIARPFYYTTNEIVKKSSGGQTKETSCVERERGCKKEWMEEDGLLSDTEKLCENRWRGRGKTLRKERSAKNARY